MKKKDQVLFPNQIVLVSILEYHHEGDKKIVNEVAPIRAVVDIDANKEFFNANEGIWFIIQQMNIFSSIYVMNL